MAAEHFIQRMHMKKGALTEKANRAGETPMEFAQEHKHDSGETGSESRLAITLRRLGKHRKKH